MAVVAGGESGGAVKELSPVPSVLVGKATVHYGRQGLCQLRDVGEQNGCLGIIWELLGLRGWG